MITRRVLYCWATTAPRNDQTYYVSQIIFGPLKANHELVQSPSQAHFKEENEEPAASFPFPIDRFRNFHEAKKAIKVGSRSFRENLSPPFSFLMHQFSKEEETKQKKKSCFEMNEKNVSLVD